MKELCENVLESVEKTHEYYKVNEISEIDLELLSPIESINLFISTINKYFLNSDITTSSLEITVLLTDTLNCISSNYLGPFMEIIEKKEVAAPLYDELLADIGSINNLIIENKFNKAREMSGRFQIKMEFINESYDDSKEIFEKIKNLLEIFELISSSPKTPAKTKKSCQVIIKYLKGEMSAVNLNVYKKIYQLVVKLTSSDGLTKIVSNIINQIITKTQEIITSKNLDNNNFYQKEFQSIQSILKIHPIKRDSKTTLTIIQESYDELLVNLNFLIPTIEETLDRIKEDRIQDDWKSGLSNQIDKFEYIVFVQGVLKNFSMRPFTGRGVENVLEKSSSIKEKSLSSFKQYIDFIIEKIKLNRFNERKLRLVWENRFSKEILTNIKLNDFLKAREKNKEIISIIEKIQAENSDMENQFDKFLKFRSLFKVMINSDECPANIKNPYAEIMKYSKNELLENMDIFYEQFLKSLKFLKFETIISSIDASLQKHITIFLKLEKICSSHMKHEYIKTYDILFSEIKKPISKPKSLAEINTTYVGFINQIQKTLLDISKGISSIESKIEKEKDIGDEGFISLLIYCDINGSFFEMIELSPMIEIQIEEYYSLNMVLRRKIVDDFRIYLIETYERPFRDVHFDKDIEMIQLNNYQIFNNIENRKYHHINDLIVKNKNILMKLLEYDELIKNEISQIQNNKEVLQLLLSLSDIQKHSLKQINDLIELGENITLNENEKLFRALYKKSSVIMINILSKSISNIIQNVKTMIKQILLSNKSILKESIYFHLYSNINEALSNITMKPNSFGEVFNYYGLVSKHTTNFLRNVNIEISNINSQIKEVLFNIDTKSTTLAIVFLNNMKYFTFEIEGFFISNITEEIENNIGTTIINLLRYIEKYFLKEEKEFLKNIGCKHEEINQITFNLNEIESIFTSKKPEEIQNLLTKSEVSAKNFIEKYNKIKEYRQVINDKRDLIALINYNDIMGEEIKLYVNELCIMLKEEELNVAPIKYVRLYDRCPIPGFYENLYKNITSSINYIIEDMKENLNIKNVSFTDSKYKRVFLKFFDKLKMIEGIPVNLNSLNNEYNSIKEQFICFLRELKEVNDNQFTTIQEKQELDLNEIVDYFIFIDTINRIYDNNMIHFQSKMEPSIIEAMNRMKSELISNSIMAFFDVDINRLKIMGFSTTDVHPLIISKNDFKSSIECKAYEELESLLEKKKNKVESLVSEYESISIHHNSFIENIDIYKLLINSERCPENIKPIYHNLFSYHDLDELDIRYAEIIELHRSLKQGITKQMLNRHLREIINDFSREKVKEIKSRLIDNYDLTSSSEILNCYIAALSEITSIKTTEKDHRKYSHVHSLMMYQINNIENLGNILKRVQDLLKKAQNEKKDPIDTSSILNIGKEIIEKDFQEFQSELSVMENQLDSVIRRKKLEENYMILYEELKKIDEINRKENLVAENINKIELKHCSEKLIEKEISILTEIKNRMMRKLIEVVDNEREKIEGFLNIIRNSRFFDSLEIPENSGRSNVDENDFKQFQKQIYDPWRLFESYVREVFIEVSRSIEQINHEFVKMDIDALDKDKLIKLKKTASTGDVYTKEFKLDFMEVIEQVENLYQEKIHPLTVKVNEEIDSKKDFFNQIDVKLEPIIIDKEKMRIQAYESNQFSDTLIIGKELIEILQKKYDNCIIHYSERFEKYTDIKEMIEKYCEFKHFSSKNEHAFIQFLELIKEYEFNDKRTYCILLIDKLDQLMKDKVVIDDIVGLLNNIGAKIFNTITKGIEKLKNIKVDQRFMSKYSHFKDSLTSKRSHIKHLENIVEIYLKMNTIETYTKMIINLLSKLDKVKGKLKNIDTEDRRLFLNKYYESVENLFEMDFDTLDADIENILERIKSYGKYENKYHEYRDLYENYQSLLNIYSEQQIEYSRRCEIPKKKTDESYKELEEEIRNIHIEMGEMCERLNNSIQDFSISIEALSKRKFPSLYCNISFDEERMDFPKGLPDKIFHEEIYKQYVSKRKLFDKKVWDLISKLANILIELNAIGYDDISPVRLKCLEDVMTNPSSEKISEIDDVFSEMNEIILNGFMLRYQVLLRNIIVNIEQSYEIDYMIVVSDDFQNAITIIDNISSLADMDEIRTNTSKLNSILKKLCNNIVIPNKIHMSDRISLLESEFTSNRYSSVIKTAESIFADLKQYNELLLQKSIEATRVTIEQYIKLLNQWNISHDEIRDSFNCVDQTITIECFRSIASILKETRKYVAMKIKESIINSIENLNSITNRNGYKMDQTLSITNLENFLIKIESICSEGEFEDEVFIDQISDVLDVEMGAKREIIDLIGKMKDDFHTAGIFKFIANEEFDKIFPTEIYVDNTFTQFQFFKHFYNCIEKLIRLLYKETSSIIESHVTLLNRIEKILGGRKGNGYYEWLQTLEKMNYRTTAQELILENEKALSGGLYSDILPKFHNTIEFHQQLDDIFNTFRNISYDMLESIHRELNTNIPNYHIIDKSFHNFQNNYGIEKQALRTGDTNDFIKKYFDLLDDILLSNELWTRFRKVSEKMDFSKIDQKNRESFVSNLDIIERLFKLNSLQELEKNLGKIEKTLEDTIHRKNISEISDKITEDIKFLKSHIKIFSTKVISELNTLKVHIDESLMFCEDEYPSFNDTYLEIKQKIQKQINEGIEKLKKEISDKNVFSKEEGILDNFGKKFNDIIFNTELKREALLSELYKFENEYERILDENVRTKYIRKIEHIKDQLLYSQDIGINTAVYLRNVEEYYSTIDIKNSVNIVEEFNELEKSLLVVHDEILRNEATRYLEYLDELITRIIDFNIPIINKETESLINEREEMEQYFDKKTAQEFYDIVMNLSERIDNLFGEKIIPSFKDALSGTLKKILVIRASGEDISDMESLLIEAEESFSNNEFRTLSKTLDGMKILTEEKRYIVMKQKAEALVKNINTMWDELVYQSKTTKKTIKDLTTIDDVRDDLLTSLLNTDDIKKLENLINRGYDYEKKMKILQERNEEQYILDQMGEIRKIQKTIEKENKNSSEVELLSIIINTCNDASKSLSFRAMEEVYIVTKDIFHGFNTRITLTKDFSKQLERTKQMKTEGMEVRPLVELCQQILDHIETGEYEEARQEISLNESLIEDISLRHENKIILENVLQKIHKLKGEGVNINELKSMLECCKTAFEEANIKDLLETAHQLNKRIDDVVVRENRKKELLKDYDVLKNEASKYKKYLDSRLQIYKLKELLDSDLLDDSEKATNIIRNYLIDVKTKHYDNKEMMGNYQTLKSEIKKYNIYNKDAYQSIINYIEGFNKGQLFDNLPDEASLSEKALIKMPFTHGMEMEVLLVQSSGEWIKEDIVGIFNKMIFNVEQKLKTLAEGHFFPKYISKKIKNGGIYVRDIKEKNHIRGNVIIIEYKVNGKYIPIEIIGRDPHGAGVTWILEIVTPPCEYFSELEWWARKLNQLCVAEINEMGDYCILSTGLNPIYKYSTGISFSDHHHIGISDLRLRKQAYNLLRVLIPNLLSLTVNSPIEECEYSCTMKKDKIIGKNLSYRLLRNESQLSGRDPSSFIPHLSFNNELEDFIRLVGRNDFNDARLVDIFPFTRFGTIEIRLFDAQLTINDRLGIALLLQAICLKAKHLLEMNIEIDSIEAREIIENRKRAIIKGGILGMKPLSLKKDSVLDIVLPIKGQASLKVARNERIKYLYESNQRLFKWLWPEIREISGNEYYKFFATMFINTFGGSNKKIQPPLSPAQFQLYLLHEICDNTIYGNVPSLITELTRINQESTFNIDYNPLFKIFGDPILPGFVMDEGIDEFFIL